jgi:hypothetical protein
VAEQAALALTGSPVSVTMICLALLRTVMSTEGADPADVATAALAAAREGKFVMMPDEWRTAVRDRADGLASGQPPRCPASDLTTVSGVSVADVAACALPAGATLVQGLCATTEGRSWPQSTWGCATASSKGST